MTNGVNWAKVRELRAMGYTYQRIHEELGCSQSMAKKVIDAAKRGQMEPRRPHFRGSMTTETGETLDELLEAGELDNSKIAAQLGVRRASVVARRRALGLNNNPDHRAHLTTTVDDRLDMAGRMIADGESRLAVKKLVGMSDKTLEKYFPGTAWTPAQCGEYAQMTHELNYIAASVYGVKDLGYVQQKSVSMGHRYGK